MGKLMMFLPIALELLTGWLRGKVVTDRDKDRAALITALADSAARWLVMANPDKNWVELVDMVVDHISPRVPKDTELYDMTIIARGAVMEVLKTFRGQVDPLTDPWSAPVASPLPTPVNGPLGGDPITALPDMPS